MHPEYIPLTLLLFSLLLVGCQSPPSENGAQDVDTRAENLAQRSIIVDGHIDLPNRLRQFPENPADSTLGGDLDYPLAQAGGLNAPFMSIYIPTELQDEPGASKKRADALIDIVEGVARDHQDKFALATSPDDVRQIAQTNRVALPMGMENGSGLEDNLDNVRHFYERGIRYITLTHGEHNKIGDSSYDDSDPRWNGLSPFGEKVVTEMNRLGIMVDVSHVTDSTAFDAIAQSKAPVIASHSSCRHFTPGWERNASDEVIRGIADSGGVIMITFGSSFLRSDYQDRDDPIREEVEAHIDSMRWSEDSREAVAYEEQMRDQHPIGTVSDVADHIDHAVELVGVDHVGLGSDFDGVFALPEGLQDASGYPNLVAELLRREYSENEIQKILGGNILRVWEEVEQVASPLEEPA